VQAAEDMFTKTSTDWAPWTLVEAEDKKYARIKVLRTVVEAIEAKVGAGAAHPNATAE